MIEVNETDIAQSIVHKMKAANAAHRHVKLANEYNGEQTPTDSTKFDTELRAMLDLLRAMGIGFAVEWDEAVEDYAEFIIDGVHYPVKR